MNRTITQRAANRPAKTTTAAQLPHIYAAELFGSQGEAVIEYRGQRYRLKVTDDGMLRLAPELS